MFNISKNIALMAAFACAPYVCAQSTQTSPAGDKSPAPDTAAPARRPRRAGFLGDLGGERVTAKPTAMRFTLEDAVAKALVDNRDLRAAAYIVREAEGRREGAGLLSNPELELSAGPGTYGRDTGLFQGSFMQKFPVTSRLKLEKRYADIEIAAAREEVLIARRRLIGEVKADAVRLIALRDEADLLRKQRDLAEKFAGDTKARVERGEADSIQAGFLALESADNADLIARTEADRAALLASFRVKLGLKTDEDADIAGDLPDSRDNYGQPDPSACPECRKMVLLTDASQTAVELEMAKKWQDIGVGVFGQLEHTSDDHPTIKEHETLGYVGLRVTVPLPLWNDNSGAVRLARARRERLKEELAAEIMRLDGEAQSARRELDKLASRLPELREKLVPAARAQTEMVKTSLERGEGDPANLYRALDKQTSLERRELTLRRDIALAYVRLETALSAHPAMKEEVKLPDVVE